MLSKGAFLIYGIGQPKLFIKNPMEDQTFSDKYRIMYAKKALAIHTDACTNLNF